MDIGDPWFDVELDITLTRDEVRVLAECSQGHYDAKCRGASIPGRGAWINGFKTCLLVDEGKAPETATRRLTFSDLDLGAKILEQSRWLSTEEDKQLGYDLYVAFRGAMCRANELFREVNKERLAKDRLA